MDDFFDTCNSLESEPSLIKTTFQSIYGWTPKLDCFLGINLQWPKFDLPDNYTHYFLSWHTEQLDLHWLIDQAKRVYPKPILLVNDGYVDLSVVPDNVEFVRWISWHKQIDQLIDRFGVCLNPQLPKYKISSLSYRLSQYKRFVTAYLIKHADPQDLILTYHKVLGKPEDLHDHPKGFPWLDALDVNLEPTFINFNDSYTSDKNTVIDNGGWRNPAFQDALINFTNESFHYSLSQIDNKSFFYPGPYLTEKTWKPLLAGRPFLSIGQYRTNQTLQELGLSTNFGFPEEFDSDPGDLTRIHSIFQTIDVIVKTPIKDLYEQSYEAVTHNAQFIQTGDFFSVCNRKNEQADRRIQDFLSV